MTPNLNAQGDIRPSLRPAVKPDLKPNLSPAFAKAETVTLPKAGAELKVVAVLGILGIVLTLGLYWITSQKTVDLVQQRRDNMTSAITQYYFHKLQKQADMLTSMAQRLSRHDEGVLRQIRSASSRSQYTEGTKAFDFVALLEPSANGRLSLIERSADLSTMVSLQSISLSKDDFISHYSARGAAVQVITYQSLANQLQQLGSHDANDPQLIFIKPFRKNDGSTAILIAENAAKDIFDTEIEASIHSLREVSLSLPDTGQVLRRYKNDSTHASLKFLPVDQSYQEDKDFTFAGSRWQLALSYGADGISNAMIIAPYAMLALGVIFTLIAMGLVWAQLSQAKRIKLINRILEDRNRALESEGHKREKLNEELMRSEEENLALINSISDVIFETDSKGNIVFVNDTWARITGFDVAQTRGKNLFNLIAPEDQVQETDKFSQMLQGLKTAYRSFTRLRCIDGTYRAVELSMSMVKISDDETRHMIGSINDIEERRRAEEALGQVERQYREIVENAVWGIYQMSPQGVFISANPAMVALLGYDNFEALQNGIDNALDQVYGDKHERRSFLREVEQSGVAKSRETHIYNSAGEKIWVSENIRAVHDENGNCLYFEGSVEDISNRKESDIMLRDAKIHSDMANRAKSEFLTNMSHELRTPLNAIIGFSEIIKNESFGPVGHESYKEYITEVYEGGKHLLKVINEILDISRIEVRERELNESTVDLAQVMTICADLLRGKADAGQIEIENMLQNVPAVIAEERAMKQVFTNILSNAIKFTPRGGKVILSSELTSEGDISISFADTGVGLDVEEVKKALSPFGQVGSSLDQDHAGTGLGLTLVKALVELHDGKLDIFSQKGMGTTVTIQLPAARVVKPKQMDYEDLLSEAEARSNVSTEAEAQIKSKDPQSKDPQTKDAKSKQKSGGNMWDQM